MLLISGAGQAARLYEAVVTIVAVLKSVCWISASAEVLCCMFADNVLLQSHSGVVR